LHDLTFSLATLGYRGLR